MKKIPHFPSTSLFFLLLLSAASAAAAGEPNASAQEFGLGLTQMGGQTFWGLSQNWELEMRYLQSIEHRDRDSLRAQVVGLRLYRYFHPMARGTFFWGAEPARAQARERSGGSDKLAGGLFTGFEYYPARRISVGVDVGPYFVYLKKDAADAGTNVVVNSFIDFYFF